MAEERIPGLETWAPAYAPSGFADRVVAAWEAERRPESSARRWPLAVAATAVVVAVVLTLWAWPTAAVTGSLAARERTEVDLADRAVAVAEAGASLRWTVEGDGRATVDQPAGAVFYRVDRGPAFVVTTPRGSVRVKGTSFSVEVIDMGDRRLLKGSLVGAAVSAAVVVTVYEGGVVLADDGRSVEVGAGEAAISDGDGGPRRVEDGADDLATLAAADPQALVTRLRAQTGQLQRLQARYDEQQAELERLRDEARPEAPTDETSPARVQRCIRADREEPGCSFFAPDETVLAAMADCGMIKVDVPAFLEGYEIGDRIEGPWAARAELTEAESESLARVAQAFHDDHAKRLRRLYLDAGGLPEVVDDVDMNALRTLTRGLFDREELDDARRRLARERAGQAEPPEELTLADRFFRTYANVGKDFEAAVAEVVGKERARALRAVDDGWPGGTSVHSDGCEPR